MRKEEDLELVVLDSNNWSEEHKWEESPVNNNWSNRSFWWWCKSIFRLLIVSVVLGGIGLVYGVFLGFYQAFKQMFAFAKFGLTFHPDQVKAKIDQLKEYHYANRPSARRGRSKR